MTFAPRHLLPALLAVFALTACNGEFSFEANLTEEQQQIREENRQRLVDDSLGISITHTKLPSYKKRDTRAELMCVDEIAYLNIVVTKTDTGLGATTTRTPELDVHCPIVDDDVTIQSDEVPDITDDAADDAPSQSTTDQDSTEDTERIDDAALTE